MPLSRATDAWVNRDGPVCKRDEAARLPGGQLILLQIRSGRGRVELSWDRVGLARDAVGLER